MTSFEETGNPLTEEDVTAFEERLGHSLPSDYKLFLLDHNGGRPLPDVVDIAGWSGKSTDIQEFFGLGRAQETSNLDWNRQTLQDRIDEDLLPIACDSGNNIYALSLRTTDRGHILFCHFVESAVSYHPVARSFRELLIKLRPFE
jgi:cell wall assembly regulator SMI1